MTAHVHQQLTTILGAIRDGDHAAKDELFRLVEKELHSLAEAKMRHERVGHTLQATALVNEAYIRLCGNLPQFDGSGHFYAAASEAMRRILVEHARKRLAEKRFEGKVQTMPSDVDEIVDNKSLDPKFVVALNDAIDTLASLNPRQAQVFVLSYYGGMKSQDIARHLEISPRTVQADHTTAKTWLHEKICA